MPQRLRQSLQGQMQDLHQHIDQATNELLASGMDETQAKLKGVEEFAVEAAILKVFGSEAKLL